MNNKMIIDGIRKELSAHKGRKKWEKGVFYYAMDLVDGLEEYGFDMSDSDLMSMSILHKSLLNGASGWNEYSFTGSALCYNSDIADRLFTKAEQKRGISSDTLFSKQAEALYQAECRIIKAWDLVLNKICISRGNDKMGNITSVYLQAVIT